MLPDSGAPNPGGSEKAPRTQNRGGITRPGRVWVLAGRSGVLEENSLCESPEAERSKDLQTGVA